MSTGESTLLSSLTGPGQDVADLIEALPAVVGVLRGADLVVELANPRFRDLAGGRPLLGRPAREVFGQPENRPLLDLAEEVIATGEPRRGAEAPARVMGEDRGERPAQLDADIDRFTGAEALRFRELFEGSALDQIHPQTNPALFVIGTVDAHHIRVPHPGQQPRLVEDRRRAD